MSFDEEEAFEHTLLVVREVTVYKIPPRSTSGGYKCGEWLQSDKIWSGRLRVVSCTDRCEIRLEDPNSGELFAACFVLPGQREISVETVLDSSRYFVLKIEDGQGKHAFIGLGFTERNEAFDFNVVLSDHEKHVKREHEREAGEEHDDNHIDIHPAVNHRLKVGETIRINVKNKPSAGTGMLSAAGLSGGVSGSRKPGVSLAPPPSGAGKIRSPLPPPPSDPVAARIASDQGLHKVSKDNARHTSDSCLDLSQIEVSLFQVDKHRKEFTYIYKSSSTVPNRLKLLRSSTINRPLILYFQHSALDSLFAIPEESSKFLREILKLLSFCKLKIKLNFLQSFENPQLEL